MKLKLKLDGYSLQLSDLLEIIGGATFTVEVAPCNRPNATCDLSNFDADMAQTMVVEELQPEAVLAAYATGTGKMFPQEVGLLVLLLWVNEAMKIPHIICPALIARAASLLNAGVYPALHREGASERAAMCELGLILSGSSDSVVYYHNKPANTSDVLKTATLPIAFALNVDEATALTKFCAVSTASALVALKRATDLVKNADITLSMMMEAIRGELGAFDARIHELGRPFPNQIKSAANVRQMLAGSQFTSEEGRQAFGGDHGPRVQDAISFRASPQTHGGVRDTIAWLAETLEKDINALPVHINPQTGYALDLMIIGLADLGNISERRTFRITDSGLSYGLPMNLVASDPGFNHGFPVVQAAATAVLAEVKTIAVPSVALNCLTDVAPYSYATFQSAAKALDVCELLVMVFAVELFMAAQGMDLVAARMSHLQPGKGTAAVLSAVRKTIPMTDKDRFVRTDLVESCRLISSGEVLKAAENAVGVLANWEVY